MATNVVLLVLLVGVVIITQICDLLRLFHFITDLCQISHRPTLHIGDNIIHNRTVTDFPVSPNLIIIKSPNRQPQQHRRRLQQQ